ncbi:MAG: HNH endonuclease [Paracoccaceae bacterium]|jgi:putative restriction endonuclease|nr:HNH endonuclease [Paracoccaceae bacterium]
MAFGVFMHRADSVYADIPSTQYQFPKSYLSRAEPMVGDWIVYLEPGKVAGTRGYLAVAQVDRILPDPTLPDMFRAMIVPGSYLDFGTAVPFRVDGMVVERGVLNAAGRISGRAQAAVRPLSPADFARIVDLGIGQDEDVLPRVGTAPGLAEAPAPFELPPAMARVRQLGTRALRDRAFRMSVLRAYGARCAITGLRLINGGGRAEVEAAHIQPVEEQGPDMIQNGLALSGTAHWMFDRGLVGLSEDLRILVSRQANDPDAVRAMINPSGVLLPPLRPSDRPHPHFVTWHREHRFKS